MHQFWETDKMIRLVTSDLKGRCRALASVVALACCSKRLSDIALDAVWEELEDQGQLMTCLPSDTWEIRNDEFVRTTWVYYHFRGAHKSTGFLTLSLH